MIAETIRLLQTQKFYGAGKFTEIAKGKNAIPKTWEEVKEQIKRRRIWLFTKR